MLEKIVIRSLLFLVIALSLSATGALGRNQYEVLFIWDGAEEFIASDDALRDYLENDLGYYVEYFDDDEPEEPTEDAAWDSDVVFISESVTSYSIEGEITEVAVPFVTTECWGWPEMGLTYGDGESIDVDNVNIEMPIFINALPDEWIKTLDRFNEMDIDHVVPGHGDVTDKSAFPLMKDMILMWVDVVGGAIKEGLDLEGVINRVKETKGFPEIPAGHSRHSVDGEDTHCQRRQSQRRRIRLRSR